MTVSYCLRGSVAKIGLYGYVQYDSNMIKYDLSEKSSKLLRPCGGHSLEFDE